MGKPPMPLLWEAVREFFPRGNAAKDIFIAPWFHSEFIHRNHAALFDCPTRVKFLSHLPSFQYNLDGLDGERRLAAYWALNPKLIREVRYPYLDRDFLSFMYAIPREQVVRVGQHRFLMRRALAGIVPDELLNRKRKAFLPPESEKDKSAEVLGSVEIGHHMLSSSIGIIDPSRFSEALQKVTRKEEALMGMLTRTLKLESWLRHLASHRILAAPKISDEPEYYVSVNTNESPLSLQRKSSAS